MREQLIQYVNLLFAGAADAEEIKQEILQNTLDRYDDLIAQGKSPEAAYRLAISGIGDINEILGSVPKKNPASAFEPIQEILREPEDDEKRKKIRGFAIALYILCAVPILLFSAIGLDELGVCLTLVVVAFATYLMIVTGKKGDDDDNDEDEEEYHTPSPQKKLKKSIGSLVWAIGLAIYFILSFATGAWYITWILFPLIGCVDGLIDAIIDLKEATKK